MDMDKNTDENDVELSTDTDRDTLFDESSDDIEIGMDVKMENSEIVRDTDFSVIQNSLCALQELFEKQIARNQNQTEMFDKLYAEMKDYKESFLLEVLHKPIIHNLIQLYDSYLSLESQLDALLSDEEEVVSDALSQYRNNLENFRYKLEEVLYRLDVTPFAESVDTLDRQLHKTRQTISTDNPELDKKIAEVHKVGFNWRDKVFRPEEVTIYRYAVSGENRDGIVNNSSVEKGGNTDG